MARRLVREAAAIFGPFTVAVSRDIVSRLHLGARRFG
jgi:hypothetical protein